MAQAHRCAYLIETSSRRVGILLKYTTKVRSPWQFFFGQEEVDGLKHLRKVLGRENVYLGLICHTDGICCVHLPEIAELGLAMRDLVENAVSVHRPRGRSYRFRGPGRNELPRAIPQNRWPEAILGEAKQ